MILRTVSGAAMYAGYNPTVYVTSKAELDTALANAAADDIIGVQTGTYTATDIAASNTVPAWKTAANGTAGHPIRIVAQYPAVMYPNNSSLWTELRCGETVAWQGNPAFGCNGNSYVEWIGFYANEDNSPTTGSCGLAQMRSSSNCAIKYCRLHGSGDYISDSLRSGVYMQDNTGGCVVSYNKIDNFSPGIGNSNESAIICFDVGTVTIEQNEIYDCAGGVFVKHNDGEPGKITIRRNLLRDLAWTGIRLDTMMPSVNAAHGADVYQNLLARVRFAFMIGDSGTPDAMEAYCRFVNNTIYDCGTPGNAGYAMHIAASFDTNAGHLFWNNIVHTADQAYALAPSDVSMTEANLDCEHNVFYQIGTPFAQTAWS